MAKEQTQATIQFPTHKRKAAERRRFKMSVRKMNRRAR
jgi:hypothetical protein